MAILLGGGSTSITDLTLPSGPTGTRPASPVKGYTRYNTTIGLIEYFDGSYWRPVTGYSNGSIGTGGDAITVTKNGSGIMHQFTSVSSATFTPTFTGYVQVLVVGGGGGSGGGWAGGGGGGGVVFNRAYPVTAGVGISLSVGGSGPASPGNGGNSTFGSITAYGGGGSGYWDNGGQPNGGAGATSGFIGGSGGGGGNTSIDSSRMRCGGGRGISGQGFPGGSGVRYNDDGENSHNGGGGGGAGGPGGDAQDANIRSATIGGPGAANDIMGEMYYWGGGGASGPHICDGGGGAGGVGGGGGGATHYYPGLSLAWSSGIGGGQALNQGGNASNNGTHGNGGGAGGANTGGGGGGGGGGGNVGGSGIVVVRY